MEPPRREEAAARSCPEADQSEEAADREPEEVPDRDQSATPEDDRDAPRSLRRTPDRRDDRDEEAPDPDAADDHQNPEAGYLHAEAADRATLDRGDRGSRPNPEA